MSEQAHTPTPWSNRIEDLRGGRYFVVVREPAIDTIDLHENDNGEADAAYIVKAVNNFYRLLEALGNAEIRLRGAGMLGGDDDPVVNTLAQIRDTLHVKAR